jgi:transposase InsO family protein
MLLDQRSREGDRQHECRRCRAGTATAETGIESVKLPPRSPNLNAHAERFVRTIKESCLEQTILFGEDSLRKAINEFVVHYHTERNHQGLSNQLIMPMKTAEATGTVQCRQRLGGMLKYYYRQAA